MSEQARNMLTATIYNLEILTSEQVYKEISLLSDSELERVLNDLLKK